MLPQDFEYAHVSFRASAHVFSELNQKPGPGLALLEPQESSGKLSNWASRLQSYYIFSVSYSDSRFFDTCNVPSNIGSAPEDVARPRHVPHGAAAVGNTDTFKLMGVSN